MKCDSVAVMIRAWLICDIRAVKTCDVTVYMLFVGSDGSGNDLKSLLTFLLSRTVGDFSHCCEECVRIAVFVVCGVGVMESSHDVFVASPLLLVSNFLSPSFLPLPPAQHSHVREPAGILQDAGWEDWEGEEDSGASVRLVFDGRRAFKGRLKRRAVRRRPCCRSAEERSCAWCEGEGRVNAAASSTYSCHSATWIAAVVSDSTCSCELIRHCQSPIFQLLEAAFLFLVFLGIFYQ